MIKGRPSTRAIDLTGQTFYRWNVLHRVESIKGQAAFLCKCACGTEKIVKGWVIRRGISKSCGCVLSDILRERNKQLGYRTAERNRQNCGEKSPNWKGGRFVDSYGYVRIRVSPGKYRLEHIVVMERRLGRPLLKGETVHHKNGIRSDNSEGNLELWSSNHPSGQRVKDVLMWCKEYIRKYEGVI